MPSPIGIMDISTPRVKSDMPKMRSSAPNRKRTTGPGSSGTKVTDRISTMAVMGNTEVSASDSFSLSFLFINKCCFIITVAPVYEAVVFFLNN